MLLYYMETLKLYIYWSQSKLLKIKSKLILIHFTHFVDFFFFFFVVQNVVDKIDKETLQIGFRIG
jgi:hypothetical protein